MGHWWHICPVSKTAQASWRFGSAWFLANYPTKFALRCPITHASLALLEVQTWHVLKLSVIHRKATLPKRAVTLNSQAGRQAQTQGSSSSSLCFPLLHFFLKKWRLFFSLAHYAFITRILKCVYTACSSKKAVVQIPLFWAQWSLLCGVSFAKWS
jgi:hypothetical protein